MRKYHAIPESSTENLRESSGACATEITPLPGLQLKEEIADIEIGPHPAETYVAPEADVAISAEHERLELSMLRRSVQPKRSEGVSDRNPRGFGRIRFRMVDCCLGQPPMRDDEIASVAQANQLARDWIRAVSAVPNAEFISGWRGRVHRPGTYRRRAAKQAPVSSWSPAFLQHQSCASGPGFEALPRLPAMEQRCRPLLRALALKRGWRGCEHRCRGRRLDDADLTGARTARN